MSSSTGHGAEKLELENVTSIKSSSSLKDLSLGGQTSTASESIVKAEVTAVNDPEASRWLSGRKLVIVHSAMLLAFVPDRPIFELICF